MAEPLIIALPGRTPKLDATSWVAPNAVVVGNVSLGANASVWYSATLRAEFDPIEVGPGSNVQDSVTIHTDPGFPVKIGARVTIGHNAVLHGCTVEDDCLIGIGAVIGNGATVGAQSLIAPGAVVPQRMVIPPRSMVVGVPAKVRRELTPEEIEANSVNAPAYEYLLGVHRDATSG
ncbi:gamma carbonic anhydrase family protein [Mycolicibacterium vaccae]|jgi:carbonic anhydrase/acetyltransferase-like protein (isoleucine patch superfamily)|uniref:Siderophore binding protein n=1 Tax=Mycolicibacterium vaccae ATCC 25954 TaxID=1194972 RepID=K0UZB3_MYCVA|nr:gamma carbonic anhydrase family protein [Mycolicibacterium vaccae]ANI38157.1 anhydrase [Mycolicibacterium vaccae 95051]EJZ12156.1 siderophore binding protein [Mycolicibacterium vaccae ATCC 25954]